MASRSFEDAITCLNSLQSNAAHLEAARASGNKNTAAAIPEMVYHLGRIGYKPDDLNRLNVIHVTGTKGKGSTCAFIDSIVRKVRPDWKVGLYTSPHLVSVRERIRFNGLPISESDFTRCFFEVWDKLGDAKDPPQFTPRPMYFKFLTLVAYHAFLSLKVDATILEVGVGGRYDSTNIVPRPIVTGVSALGLDHTTVLGKSISEIAWQKAGIFKEGVPALTIDQPQEGMEVLKQQAVELKASNFAVTREFDEGLHNDKPVLGLSGSHQFQNAKLAVALSKEFLSQKGVDTTEPSVSNAFIEALKSTKWPGRCQTIPDPTIQGLTWFLDGAHTTESIDCCVQWFVSPNVALRHLSSSSRPVRVLIFNCTHGRSGGRFLGSMMTKAEEQLRLHDSREQASQLFDHVIFCTNVTYADGHFKAELNAVGTPEDELKYLSTQHELAQAWKTLAPEFPQEHIHVLPSIEHALRIAKHVSDEAGAIDVLVAGSLHLVGGMIEVAGLSNIAL